VRGTLHFTAAEDVLWVLNPVAPETIVGSKRRNGLHLDETVYERSRDIFINALEGREWLTQQDDERPGGSGYLHSVAAGMHIHWHLTLERGGRR